MSIDINKHEVDIDTLFKQNENDLVSIKELYRKIEELEKKISEIKYVNEVLANKLQKEYESLKKVIINENIQVKLTNDINDIKSRLENLENQVGKKEV